MSRRVLNLAREGDCPASLGSLFQRSVALAVQKFLHILVWNFLCPPSSCWPFPRVLSPQTAAKRLAVSLCLPHRRS